MKLKREGKNKKYSDFEFSTDKIFFEASSFKKGFSPYNLFENDNDKFWQTNSGMLPHSLLMKFSNRIVVSSVHLLLNYTADSSYVPQTISVFAGLSRQTLSPVGNFALHQPNGWVKLEFPCETECVFLKLFFESNHENGKDCRVRSLKVLCPTLYLKEMFDLFSHSLNNEYSRDALLR